MASLSFYKHFLSDGALEPLLLCGPREMPCLPILKAGAVAIALVNSTQFLNQRIVLVSNQTMLQPW